MRKARVRIAVLVALTGGLAACGGGGTVSSSLPTGRGVYKVGNPYQIAGVWYYPHEQPDYDATGIGSWYGAQFHGHVTSNGEIFDRNAVSAAHPTLPLPSNVRVTNLENGRSAVVRVNDRGPYVNGRIIDLSERAADLLGYHGKGTARVRVTYLGRADLNGRGTVPPVLETPPEVIIAAAAAPTAKVAAATLAPVPGAAIEAPPPAEEGFAVPEAPQPESPPQVEPEGQVTEVPVPPVTAIYVQAGAYSSLDNANRVAATLKNVGARVSRIMKEGRPLYRVRVGPFQDVGQADAALNEVLPLHADSGIVVD